MGDKKWTKEEIRRLLESRDDAVVRGLIVLYSLQTSEEQSEDRTVEKNNVGFNALDAEFLSSLARYAEKRGMLTEKQMYYARKRILKYAGQLARIANGLL